MTRALLTALDILSHALSELVILDFHQTYVFLADKTDSTYVYPYNQ